MIGASRWWHAGLAAAIAVCLAIVALTEPLERLLGTAAVFAVFALFWAVLGRRASPDGRPLAIVVIVATIATAAGAAAFATPAATFQFFAYPVIWSLSRTTRGAVVGKIGRAHV